MDFAVFGPYVCRLKLGPLRYAGEGWGSLTWIVWRQHAPWELSHQPVLPRPVVGGCAHVNKVKQAGQAVAAPEPAPTTSMRNGGGQVGRDVDAGRILCMLWRLEAGGCAGSCCPSFSRPHAKSGVLWLGIFDVRKPMVQRLRIPFELDLNIKPDQAWRRPT